MINWGRKINEDYAWEFSGLHKLREFSDGLSIFEFRCNWDRYLADHTPRLEISLVILNFMVFEFNIYYLWHQDDPEPFDKETKVWTSLDSSNLPTTISTGNWQISETQSD